MKWHGYTNTRCIEKDEELLVLYILELGSVENRPINELQLKLKKVQRRLSDGDDDKYDESSSDSNDDSEQDDVEMNCNRLVS